MENEAKKAKKNNLFIKLKYTPICWVDSSQGKIIPREINHLKQICKRKKSIDQFEDKTKWKEKPINLQKEGKTTGQIDITIQIDKNIRIKSPWTAHRASNSRPLSDGRALRHRTLSECATWHLKELVSNSLYNYACWRLRLVTHLSGPAELLELPWVVSEPIAETTSAQPVVTMLIRVSWL